MLPIGGVKEKVLAAHRAGVRTIILPERNRLDLEEVPKAVLEGPEPVRFYFVKEMSQVLELALLSEEESKQQAMASQLDLQPLAVN